MKWFRPLWKYENRLSICIYQLQPSFLSQSKEKKVYCIPSKTWAGTATVWCYCMPVRYVGTSYTSASARDGILSGRRAGAHRTDYVVAISKTIVNSRFGRLPCLCRPSIASQSVLMCPYETCTMTDHWKVGTIVWHCASLIWTHISFKLRRRNGRGTTVSRTVNSWWPCSL